MKYYINKPCVKTKDDLEPIMGSDHKFCNDCSRCIFDFSTSSDEEIDQILDSVNPEEKVCAIISLETHAESIERKRHQLKKYPKLVAAMLFMFFLALQSCKTHKPTKVGYLELESVED